MRIMRQIRAATEMNLRNVPRRLGASLVIIAGIGGTVGVVISVLAMSTSLLNAARSGGQSDREIVLHSGATSEASSGLSRADIELIAAAPGVKKTADGRPIVSAEVLEQVPAEDRKGGSDQDLLLRGVGLQFPALHPEIHLVQGRWFRSGLRELIVGQAVRKVLGGLRVGDQITLPGGPWRIVGSFTSGNESHDMELLGDAEVVITAFDADQFNSVTARLESNNALDRFRSALIGNPALAVDLQSERGYYVRQSQSLALILKVVAYLVGAIMGLGASFGALNAMYSLVAARSWEIATLRAIGFGAGAVLTSTLIEGLVLASGGALLAAAVSWLLFNDTQIIQGNGAGGSVVYSLAFTPRLALIGMMWAFVIGTLGALPPALRAAKLPVASALRTLQ